MNSYNIISEHKNPSTASYELFNRIGSDMFYIGFHRLYSSSIFQQIFKIANLHFFTR